ncbi:MAG: hypothetical protein ACRBG0_27750 [Lewinella sp.]|uniref:hypothetical protein n=1 Tax=Lewinella sp. TaxID=2004506 RepID=UPI003D6C5339
MAYTPVTIRGNQLISGGILSVDVDNATGGATAVTIPAEAMQDVSIDFEEISSSVADSDAGYPHTIKATLSFIYKPLAAAAQVTFANELTITECTAFIKVTFLSGETLTLDSGVTDQPIAYFRKQLLGGDNADTLRYQVTAEKYLPLSALTIT